MTDTTKALKIRVAPPTSKYIYRGIDFRTVERVEGENGIAPTLHFKGDREPLTLSHYPGEDTYRRATVWLNLARRDA